MKKRTFIPPNFRPKVKGEDLISTEIEKKISLDPKIQRQLEEKKATICLYVKDDSSQIKAISKHKEYENIIFLLYDDLGLTWNFSFYNGVLKFYQDNTVIFPVGIYNRPYYPEVSHVRYYLYDNLMRALEVWKGSIIGCNISNFHNSSKAYQLTTTIREAIKRQRGSKVDFPKSYFVKGIAKFNLLMKYKKKLIVKSSSGIRSEVALEENFKKWELKNINHLPVFFQHACFGPDIRVHKLDQSYWSVILHEKQGSIDYRYAKKRKAFERYNLSEPVKMFCSSLAEIESIRLIGVDFILVGKKAFCLESNPSPGWAGFHRSCGDEPYLAKELISKIAPGN